MTIDVKRFITILFVLTTSLIPTGLVFRILYWPWGNLTLALGFLGLLIFFVTKIIRDLLSNQIDIYQIWLQVIFALMSTILFAKYFHFSFGDIPGLFIIPAFVVLAFLHFTNYEIRNLNISITATLYFVISIPLFGIYIPRSPRQFIPTDWYNRYDPKENIPIKLPYGFDYDKTEQLSVKAFELRRHGYFHEAILSYHQALEIEPGNKKILFDMSDCYAKINELDSAIIILDKVISLDSTYAPFFNNRGLMYYKLKMVAQALKNYQKAIQLDPTEPAYFANSALAYYKLHDYDNACKAIRKSEQLGMDISDQELLKVIKYEECNK